MVLMRNEKNDPSVIIDCFLLSRTLLVLTSNQAILLLMMYLNIHVQSSR